RGALAVPILLGGDVFGVMEFFSRESRPPDNGLLEMAAAIGRQIGQFVERRAAEEALASSRETLELAQDAASAGTFVWNIKTNAVAWSESEERLYGLPPGGFEGRYENWRRSVHPEDRERAEARVLAAVSNCQPLDFEFRIIRPDGEIRWLAGRGRVFADAEGKPARMVGINIDITDRKKVEEELRKSEERLRLAMEAGEIGAWDWD